MTKKQTLGCILIFLFSGGLAGAADIRMAPFVVDWRDNPDSPVNLSFLLDAPAGKDGHIRIRHGHFTKPDGSRFRIWGVNLTGSACFPQKDDAPTVAAHLARYGINCVRFHFLDANWSGNIFVKGADNTRTFDAAQLDRLDYFAAELKKRGVYTNINLNVGRNFRKADGVKDYDKIGLAKVLNYFDDRIGFLHKEYAQQLLTHYNPYTKSEYRNEPAVIIIELVNENSLIEAWFSDRLLGKHTGKPAGTWQDITRHYADLLTAKYNAWLRKNLSKTELDELRKLANTKPGESIPRLTKNQLADAPEKLFHAEATFYMELENKYFQTMYRYLKEDLKIKPLIAGTSDHNHWKSGYSLVASTSKLDIVDGHVYWQHPRYTNDPKTKRRSFWIKNSPMVDDPFNSTVVQLSRTAVANKPYTVSETNHPFPNEYACEGIPILAAYAAFHDWDGIFLYTFEHADPSEWSARSCGHFDLRPDPVKMTNIAAAAVMFGRADVKPANNTVGRTYAPNQIRQDIRASTSLQPYYTPGFNTALALTQTTRITSFDKQTGPFPEIEQVNPIATDTHQLNWYHPPQYKGLVTIDTDRSQALIGFVKDNPHVLKNLSARVDNNFCSIILTSLDGKPISESQRLLLAATARSRTTNMKFNKDRTSLENWGTLPMLIEPVTGTVTLGGLSHAESANITPLDAAGRPLAKARTVPVTGNTTQFQIGQITTTWYLIEIKR